MEHTLICYRNDCNCVVRFTTFVVNAPVEAGYYCDCGHSQLRRCERCSGAGCLWCHRTGQVYAAYNSATDEYVFFA